MKVSGGINKEGSSPTFQVSCVNRANDDKEKQKKLWLRNKRSFLDDLNVEEEQDGTDRTNLLENNFGAYKSGHAFHIL